MGKIRLLSDAMIGKIAAGEVVERPAAAIKELVENSLDAGATAVSVEIRDGGLDSIRVTDNGSGIDESDIRMAFERHATSKISKEQDLFSIQTLGFRGEALASIAAVSHVTLTTRTRDRETGLRVQNDGGSITAVSETACPVGTTVTVKELFYNVPVRKGFMKKAGQEAAAVGDLMTKMLLSRPDVSFRYVSNGKTEYHSPGDGQLASALHTIYGGNALKAMREVNDHANGLMISGYVGIGENARGNRNHEFFFINGRVMQSRMLSEAVETACRERVMIGKFPTCALHITIAYEAVD
ncbi:MAG: DNA mismatch repair endonuclease MutL, partial [Clostridia bacterium]|nr:DNA mismatch repair endonuclease MutL [Clostridia bacterium]